MNYNIQDICCFCLSISDEKCSKNFSKYPDNLTPCDKIKTVLLELSAVMSSDSRICMTCSKNVDFIYKFNKTCLRNINILNSYKKVLKENKLEKKCELFVNLNEWNQFKDKLISEDVKIGSSGSPLNNDDRLCNAEFIPENQSSGVAEMKQEIQIDYKNCDGESERPWLEPEIKIEIEEIDVKQEMTSENSEPSMVKYLKPNFKDFEIISIQSTEEVVDKEEEENQELNEDPLQGVAGEKSDERRGQFEFIDINQSKYFEEKTNHVEKIVDIDSQIQLIHSKRKSRRRKEPVKCEICGKLFNFKFNLKRHLLKHTIEKSHKYEISEKLIHIAEKPYKCDTCGKYFAYLGSLNTHQLIHTGEKPHKCDICGKLFTLKGDLKKHYLIHTGEKPHKCDICGKLFSQSNSLNTHKLIHTGEKPYKCDTCGKLFSQMSNLRRHKLIHSGEKPHKCDTCGKLFIENAKLKRHMLTH